MRVLLIKMSSMGDVIHTLPALTDAAKHIPNIQFDWVVEESFQEIPSWHNAVHTVIPIAYRRWRKNWLKALKTKEPQHFIRQLRTTKYDLIIDAQGLLKSAVIAKLLAKGTVCGLDENSARESISTWFYDKMYPVVFQQHAVIRVRELFAKALGYPIPTTPADYGIYDNIASQTLEPDQPYVVFLHNTTWESKLYPELYWKQLIELATEKGFHVKLTSGNAEEKARADRLAEGVKTVEALPRLLIHDVALLLANASGVISVDTGFCHLASALAMPNVALYGPTNPEWTGAYGPNQLSLGAKFICAPCLRKTCHHPDRHQIISPPCFTTLPPEMVWQHLEGLMKQKSS